MGSTAPVEPPIPPVSALAGLRRVPARRPEVEFRFQSLVVTERESRAKGKSATLSVSLFVHFLVLAAIIVLPLLGGESLPAVNSAVHAFFVTPAQVEVPPPPPPPAAGVRIPKAPAAPRPVEETKFLAPVEVPAEIKPSEGLEVGGSAEGEGGVPGGVEGGVPGGVIGGMIGGLPDAPPPPPSVVRVGGQVVAPKLVKMVQPVYPTLATQAKVSGIIIILDALVGVDGHVKSATVIRGHPLFDEAAVTAVEQWRYQPLLLNGRPSEFILTVTLTFQLRDRQRPGQN